MTQRGLLFTAMLRLASGLEIPALDPETAMAFRFISAQMRRDMEKYERTCQRRREAGSKGGVAKVANAKFAKQNVANVADTDTVTVTETDTETVTDTETETEAQAAVKAAMCAGVKPSTKRKTKFSNFPERSYDYAELERQLL